MNKYILLVVAFLITMTIAPVNAQTVDTVPNPDIYRLDVNYFIFLDYDRDTIYTPGLDTPLPYARLDCYSGGYYFYLEADGNGEINEVFYVYEGDSWVCNTGVAVDNVDWSGTHIIVSVDSDTFFDKPLALWEIESYYLPISLR